MKTLYISDLDGTLLNSNAEVSEDAALILNELIGGGLYFTAATARTQVTVAHILESVNINVPAILMNGIMIYDFQKRKYISINAMNESGKKFLYTVIRKHINAGFLYCADESDSLLTFYESDEDIATKAFIEERERKYNKKFTKASSFADCLSERLVYYSVSGPKKSLDAAYSELKKCGELHTEFYNDIYNESHWYLEVSAAGSSKSSAALFLKEKYSFDKIVSFGDNLNDLPLFSVSDECYAVSNAIDEVKRAATGIIKSNLENGVPLKLKSLAE